MTARRATAANAHRPSPRRDSAERVERSSGRVDAQRGTVEYHCPPRIERTTRSVFSCQGDPLADTPAGGLGLGLSLVKQLVEMHGGRVDVHTEVGEGSEFVVTLPLSQGALSPSRSN